ncbi:MAG: hypothetical protein ACE5EK_03995 [Nitrospinales bacterium]
MMNTQIENYDVMSHTPLMNSINEKEFPQLSKLIKRGKRKSGKKVYKESSVWSGLGFAIFFLGALALVAFSYPDSSLTNSNSFSSFVSQFGSGLK